MCSSEELREQALACGAAHALALDTDRALLGYALEHAIAMARIRRGSNHRLAALQRFAGGAGHDLNNVFSGISGFAGFLMEDLPADDLRHRDAAEIAEAAKRGLTLCSRLMLFGERRRERQERVSFDELLTSAIDEAALAAEPTVTSAGPVGAVNVAPQALRDALTWLLQHADKACQGETLTIETSRLEGCARVSVSVPDTLELSAAEYFEPFAHARTDRAGTGVDLGACLGAFRLASGDIFARATGDGRLAITAVIPLDR